MYKRNSKQPNMLRYEISTIINHEPYILLKNKYNVEHQLCESRKWNAKPTFEIDEHVSQEAQNI